MRESKARAEVVYDIRTQQTHIRGNYYFQYPLTAADLAEASRDPSGDIPARIAEAVTHTVFDATYVALARHKDGYK